MLKPVRVVLLNWNSSQYTINCIESLRSQKQCALEIVVVDNGSSVADVIQLEQLTDPIVLIKNERNLGFSAGNNIGIQHFTGSEIDYYLFLNNDTFLNDPYVIIKLISALESADNKYVAISPLVNTVRTKLPVEYQLQIHRLPTYLECFIAYGVWLKHCPGLKKFFNHHNYVDLIPFKFNQTYDVDTINGACFLIKKEFINEIEAFDPHTFLYFEEIILGYQFLQHGKKCLLFTGATIEHYQGRSSNFYRFHAPFTMYRHFVKSETYYLKKYLHTSWLFICILVIVKISDYILIKTMAWFMKKCKSVKE